MPRSRSEQTLPSELDALLARAATRAPGEGGTDPSSLREQLATTAQLLL